MCIAQNAWYGFVTHRMIDKGSIGILQVFFMLNKLVCIQLSEDNNIAITIK